MTNRIELDVPATDEGRAFLKLLRKYLRPQYRVRTRGRNKDRKGLAKRVAGGDTEREVVMLAQLRYGVACKYADRLVTAVEDHDPSAVMFRRGSSSKTNGFYLWWNTPREQGPFKTYHAARAAQRITEGISK